MNAELDEPRPHHYTFAHKALRDACASHPFKFFAIIGSKKRDEYIEYLWSIVCEHCDPMERTDIVADDINVITTRIAENPAIIVLMPQALAIAEAHMVGIVLTDKNPDDKSPDLITYKYFTLEYGTDLEGNIQTVLGEWVNSGHLNRGDGPKNDVNKFIQHIENLI